MIEWFKGFIPSTETELSDKAKLPKPLAEYCEQIIEPERLEEYRAWAKQNRIKAEFEKLVKNMRYISFEDTESALEGLSKKIDKYVGANPYYFLVDDFGRSGYFIAEQIAKYLKTIPEGVIRTQDREMVDFNKKNRMIYLNDASYSGSQNSVYIGEFCKKFGLDSSEIAQAHIGMTQHARNQMKTELRTNTFFYEYQIPTVSEVLTETESEKIRNVFNWCGSYHQAVLTHFWFKVPDNYFGNFTSRHATMVVERLGADKFTNRRLYLVDNKKFWPPYKEPIRS